MRWEVFKNTLRYSWQPTLLWGAGLASMMLLFVLLTPALEGLDLVGLFAQLPPAILAAAGVGDDIALLGTAEGLIALGFFGKFAIIFSAFPVVMGLRTTSAEEADGTLDVVLSLPLQRSQIIFEKFLAYSLDIVLLVVLLLGGLVLGVALVDFDLELTGLALVTINLIPVLVFVLAFTIFVGALINQRQTVVMIVTGFIMASFIIQTVGGMSEAGWMEAIEATSFFTYYNVETILKQGIVVAHVAGLLGLTAALVWGSQVVFMRRDVGA